MESSVWCMQQLEIRIGTGILGHGQQLTIDFVFSGRDAIGGGGASSSSTGRTGGGGAGFWAWCGCCAWRYWHWYTIILNTTLHDNKRLDINAIRPSPQLPSKEQLYKRQGPYEQRFIIIMTNNKCDTPQRNTHVMYSATTLSSMDSRLPVIWRLGSESVH